MAYTLLAAQSTVHVLSTTEVVDAYLGTIQTPTAAAIVSSVVPATIWGTPAGVAQLNQVSGDIEYLLDNSAATAVIGSQSIDANGLLNQVATFTVEYTPPGSTLPPLTGTVDVPMPWLEEVVAPDQAHPGLHKALDLIDAEVAKLQAMAAQ